MNWILEDIDDDMKEIKRETGFQVGHVKENSNSFSFRQNVISS